MKTGTSGSVSSIRPAESGSIAATSASTASGTMQREHDLRQVAGEIRLERRRRPARPSPRSPPRRLCRERAARPAACARRARGEAPRGRSTPRAGPRPRRPMPSALLPQNVSASSARSEDTSAGSLRRTPAPRSARSGSPGAGRARPTRSRRPCPATSRRRTGRARRTSRLSRMRTVSPQATRPSASDGLGQLDVLARDPRAEDVVRPTLVEQDDRQHDQRHDGHHGQRVVLGRGPRNVEAVREVRARDHDPRIEAGEQRRDGATVPTAVIVNARPFLPA